MHRDKTLGHTNTTRVRSPLSLLPNTTTLIDIFYLLLVMHTAFTRHEKWINDWDKHHVIIITDDVGSEQRQSSISTSTLRS